jgi:CheY-like chemotaxis protein
VLIAEDEEPIAEALAMIVEEAGYAPLIAAHGKDALALARTHHPALIITDLMMPYLDGARLIQTLEEDARRDGHQRAPIIVMTAAGGRRLEHLTADALLRKPFEVEDVEELLQRFLEQESKAPSTDEERQA